MTIRINDRDVAPQNVEEAALEKEIRSIHFEFNEQFSFSDAFDAMVKVGLSLGVIGSVEKAEAEAEDSLQTELDSPQDELMDDNEISGSEQSQLEIEGDVAVSLVEAALSPSENETEPSEDPKCTSK